jgi:hypothetical protein
MKYCLFLIVLFACQQRPSVFTGELNAADDLLVVGSHHDSLFHGILRDLLPDQQLVDTSYYDGLWWSFHSRDVQPNFSVLDINDDGIADCALFVHRNQGVHLIFIVSRPDGSYVAVESDFNVVLNGKNLQYGLQIEAPGRIDRIVNNEDRSLVLKTNAVVLLHLERAIRVFYWDRNGLLSFAME